MFFHLCIGKQMYRCNTNYPYEGPPSSVYFYVHFDECPCEALSSLLIPSLLAASVVMFQYFSLKSEGQMESNLLEMILGWSSSFYLIFVYFEIRHSGNVFNLLLRHYMCNKSVSWQNVPYM